MRKFLGLVYGVSAYLLFLGTFCYAIAFVGNIAIPNSLDGAATGPFFTACLIDMGLLSLFAIQHSGMARAAFKKQITRLISPTIERATFVAASSVALLAVIAFWHPLGGAVWSVHNATGRAVLFTAFACGWGIVLITTFLINHFELFGLQQVWRNLRGDPQLSPPFVTPFLYRLVRHPLYAGFLLAFWCTPTMTAGHLLFAVMTTVYILVAIQLEERDLLRAHPEYANYRRQVPMLMPRTLRARRATLREDSASQPTTG